MVCVLHCVFVGLHDTLHKDRNTKFLMNLNTQPPHGDMVQRLHLDMTFRGSIVVSIPACHAGDPCSIPGFGAFDTRVVHEECRTNFKQVIKAPTHPLQQQWWGGLTLPQKANFCHLF